MLRPLILVWFYTDGNIDDRHEKMRANRFGQLTLPDR
jgi:hypothetical protein